MADAKDFIILGFVLYTFIQQVMFIVTTQKLINKVMSKNYHDYMFAKNVDKTMTDGELNQGVRHEQALEEDLGPLQEFAGIP